MRDDAGVRRLPVFGDDRVLPEAGVTGVPPLPAAFGRPRDVDATLPPLADVQGRRYDYLRLSVTDRCDLACRYCMPPSGEEDHALRPELLTFEEATRLVSIFGAMGIRRVRFTGGEPLVRKDFVRLVGLVRERTAVERIVMTSNATRLRTLAQPLKDAGLDGVNVSLDSLDPRRFEHITRGGDLAQVIAGIDACLSAGLEVKLNTVALRGINDQDVGAIVDWAWARGITPRFIELMPLGEAANLPHDSFVSTRELRAMLADRLRGEGEGVAGQGPASYLSAADGSSRRVGFITPLSSTFCDSCNRVRVTARGDIRACLASRKAVSLRDVMRTGASDAEIGWAIQWSMVGKAPGHQFLDEAANEHLRVGMSLVGG